MRTTLLEAVILLFITSTMLLAGIGAFLEPLVDKGYVTKGQVVGIMMIAGSLIILHWLRPGRSR